jgi:hypothetical protein
MTSNPGFPRPGCCTPIWLSANLVRSRPSRQKPERYDHARTKGREGNEHALSAAIGRIQKVKRTTGLLALVALAASVSAPGLAAAHRPNRPRGPEARSAAAHIPCSSPSSATRPCFFSTPSGNIHCVWTPASKGIECELRATRRAYLLRPTGRARLVHVNLPRRGETLPSGPNTIVFPHALSCRDTRTTMTCNQDFLAGFFKLALGRSRSG